MAGELPVRYSFQLASGGLNTEAQPSPGQVLLLDKNASAAFSLTRALAWHCNCYHGNFSFYNKLFPVTQWTALESPARRTRDRPSGPAPRVWFSSLGWGLARTLPAWSQGLRWSVLFHRRHWENHCATASKCPTCRCSTSAVSAKESQEPTVPKTVTRMCLKRWIGHFRAWKYPRLTGFVKTNRQTA